MTTALARPSAPPREIPRWAEWAARLAALTPVPSSLWRLPLIFGASMGMDVEFQDSMMAHPFWIRFCYLVGLGVLSDGLAYLTLGLVRPWGEVWPRFLPGLGGRPVPAWLPVLLGLVGGLSATVLWTYVAVQWDSGVTGGQDAWGLLMTVCYAPLVLWGPLVLVVTWHYYRRRCT